MSMGMAQPSLIESGNGAGKRRGSNIQKAKETLIVIDDAGDEDLQSQRAQNNDDV
jgi:hypothetical protein